MGSPVSTSLDWGNVAQWAAATATLFAVAVALLKEEILRLWRRPKLLATIKLAPPDSVKTIWKYPDPNQPSSLKQADCYHMRLWVFNDGNVRAEKVQVFAEKLSRRAVDGTFSPVNEFLPMNLVWANTHEVFAEGISPKMGKHLDLCHITAPYAIVDLQEDHPEVPQGKTVLCLDLEQRPYTKNHLVPPGTYRLTIRMAGSNSAPVPLTMEITLTGEWYDTPQKMFYDGFGIKMPYGKNV
jgi:hypothetical protein